MTQLVLDFSRVIVVPPYRMTWREADLRKIVYVWAHEVEIQRPEETAH
jgi:hypothetical protein